jgi:hypothetical protein
MTAPLNQAEYERELDNLLLPAIKNALHNTAHSETHEVDHFDIGRELNLGHIEAEIAYRLNRSISQSIHSLATQHVEALVAEREKEIRLNEIALVARATADPINGETWKDWSFRMLNYLEKRKAQLSIDKATHDS